jgi:hypothetical protein
MDTSRWPWSWREGPQLPLRWPVYHRHIGAPATRGPAVALSQTAVVHRFYPLAAAVPNSATSTFGR